MTGILYPRLAVAGLYALAGAVLILRLVLLPVELLGAALGPPGDRLEWLRRRGVVPMALPKDRSLAIGQLYEAVRQRAQADDKTDEQKAAIDRIVYNACLKCYEQKVTRTQVRSIIDAVVGEFRQTVA